MSAMRAGSASAGVSAQALTAAADALRSAIEAGGDQLPQVGRERAELTSHGGHVALLNAQLKLAQA